MILTFSNKLDFFVRLGLRGANSATQRNFANITESYDNETWRIDSTHKQLGMLTSHDVGITS